MIFFFSGVKLFDFKNLHAHATIVNCLVVCAIFFFIHIANHISVLFFSLSLKARFASVFVTLASQGCELVGLPAKHDYE